jgi:hypothetical protein
MKTRDYFGKFAGGIGEKFRNEHGKELKVAYVPENLPFDDEMLAFIETQWEKAKKKWPRMFNGKLYHVLRKEVGEQGIFINTIDSNYKEYVGTREPEFAKLFSSRYVINPLSVGALVITSDGKLLLGKRKYVDTWEGFYSTIAGYVQLPQAPMSPPDVIEALRQELFQEAAICEKEVTSSRFLGSAGESYLIFEVNIEIPSSTVMDREPVEKEFARIEFLQSDRKAIKKFIKQKKFNIMPGCLASLIFFGMQRFGDEWVSGGH